MRDSLIEKDCWVCRQFRPVAKVLRLRGISLSICAPCADVAKLNRETVRQSDTSAPVNTAEGGPTENEQTTLSIRRWTLCCLRG